MYKRLLTRSVLVIIFALAARNQSYAENKFSHDPLNRVLKTYVDDNGLVDYKTLRENRSDLDSYINLLGEFNPDSHPDLFSTDEAKLAYWMNAYNAFVLIGVLDKYPIASVKDVGLLPSSFFWRTKYVTGGRKITLKKLEDDIIRSRFGEPRIHFAINCASASCPKLEQRAFYPENLNDRLETAAELFINETRNVRIDVKERKIYLSSIFDWFKEDFTDWYMHERGVDGASILDYLKLYLDEDKVAVLNGHDDWKVQVIKYDWSLNDQKNLETSSR